MAKEIVPAADFVALPIEMIVATPLVAAVKAQAAAADATLSYIKGLLDSKNDVFSPKTINLGFKARDENNAERDVQLNVPLLSIVPCPHMRIDSVTTHFKYEITQVVADKSAIEKGGEVSCNVGNNPFVTATLKGSVASNATSESTTNRSGMLEITVHASEAPMPEGLSRLLSLLATMAEPKG